ncbi:MAG: hypothetical protein AB8B54_04035 [Sphingorhabdus sp.]
MARKWSLALCSVALAGCAAQTAEVNWNLAGRAFAAGEVDAPMVYNWKDASRCVSLWMLHGDAVDDGAFPSTAHDGFPEELRLPYAINAAEFFRVDQPHQVTDYQAADDAEIQLRSALAGDREAFQLYFEALGKCSTKPETVGDPTGDAVDAAAE